MTQRKPRGFSLVELVVVIVIISIIAAIAIPRITGAAQSSGGTALSADLRVFRSAIEQYRIEHEGKVPTVANIVDQLTRFSDQAGAQFADSEDTTKGIVLGPYMQSIPKLPVGSKKGSTTIAAAIGAGVGWVYNATTGKIIAGTDATEKDKDGVAYNAY